MDSPALLVTIAMLAAGAIGTLGGLAVAGLQWQGAARDDGAEPVDPPAFGGERAPAPRAPGPHRPTRTATAVTPSRQMRLGAYALAAAERAARARADAETARAEASDAQFARDEAWRALEAADQLPVPAVLASGATAVDPAVTQAAFAAFRRGDLTVDELRRVWGRPEDRDPRVAAVESARRQRLALSRAARRSYEQASVNARRAEESARVADVAAMALATEAEEAARDAAQITRF